MTGIWVHRRKIINQGVVVIEGKIKMLLILHHGRDAGKSQRLTRDTVTRLRDFDNVPEQPLII